MAIDLTRISKLHLGLVGATGGLAYATQWAQPGSLVLGGAVMGANFWLLRLIAGVLRPGGGQGRAAVAMGAFVLKFALLIGLLVALFWHVPIEGMSFAFGATLLLVACVVEAVRAERSDSKGVR